jgi:Fic/DOC family
MATQQEISHQLTVLADFVARSKAPLKIDEIAAQITLDLDRRTLQRRLDALVRDGRLIRTGQSSATRYAASPGQLSVIPARSPVQQDMFVPLSKAGAEIMRGISRPAGSRTPIGYDRNFLYRYRPNVSSYLTLPEKKRLGEISRTTIGSDQPAGTYAQRILGRLLIDLSWNSSRLEGNTYSLLDTQRLIEVGEEAEGKAAIETQMILNHKAAIEFLVQYAEEIGFNRHTILNLHALLAENLLPDPAAAGSLRAIPVSIGQSVYHPLEVPQIIEECFDRVLTTAAAIDDPFEQGFFAMVHLPYLQPFEDVNKRVSRLAANIPLIKRNLAPLSFVDVPDGTYTRGTLGIYELNRIELLRDVFLWAYERSAARYAAIRQMIGEPDQFRLRHRQFLKQVVADVVRQCMDHKQAARYIAEWSGEHIAITDRPRFIEVAETELMSMHEGNFARYQLRPSEFREWSAVWKIRKPPQLPAGNPKRKKR